MFVTHQEEIFSSVEEFRDELLTVHKTLSKQTKKQIQGKQKSVQGRQHKGGRVYVMGQEGVRELNLIFHYSKLIDNLIN